MATFTFGTLYGVPSQPGVIMPLIVKMGVNTAGDAVVRVFSQFGETAIAAIVDSDTNWTALTASSSDFIVGSKVISLNGYGRDWRVVAAGNLFGDEVRICQSLLDPAVYALFRPADLAAGPVSPKA